MDKENVTVYKMCLKFKLSMSIKELNDLNAMYGLLGKIVVPDAITVRMTQTLPFIPTEETIHEYEKVIKENYRSEKLICEDCRFDGYEYIHTVDATKGNEEPCPNRQ